MDAERVMIENILIADFFIVLPPVIQGSAVQTIFDWGQQYSRKGNDAPHLLPAQRHLIKGGIICH